MSQLRVAIALFLEVREYGEVITLARTAEQTLEDLAREAKQAPRFRGLNGSHQRLGAEAEKAFAKLGVKCGDLRRHSWGLPIEFGLEAEAMRLINRAVEKYRLLHARAASFILVYERRRDVLMRRASY
ncbi:hypothetical protein RD110_10580 [Rhodoferax koreense]|uniref:Uncharacterized protein n=1 Tax=Rhodoferax koreensis TaxID=1842727 RepID=A0A1P8JV01_9BURK|nr:hypothetical protein RD110_10580 [Rhodoferax koreense]